MNQKHIEHVARAICRHDLMNDSPHLLDEEVDQLEMALDNPVALKHLVGILIRKERQARGQIPKETTFVRWGPHVVAHEWHNYTEIAKVAFQATLECTSLQKGLFQED